MLSCTKYAIFVCANFIRKTMIESFGKDVIMKIEICYFNKDGKHYCGMAAILHYAKEHEIDVSEAIARFEDCDQPDNETVNVE